MIMNIIQTQTFIKHIKKLHPNQKKDLDCAIKEVVENPHSKSHGPFLLRCSSFF